MVEDPAMSVDLRKHLQLNSYVEDSAKRHHQTPKTVEPVGMWYVLQCCLHVLILFKIFIYTA